MADEKMTYEEAMGHLGVDEYAQTSDVFTAYRTSSADGSVDQEKLDEAFDVVRGHIMEHGVPEKPKTTSSFSYNANLADIYRMTTQEEEAKKKHREKLDAPLPDAAPATFKMVRGIVQHFPYRIGLIAIFVGICYWNMAVMTLFSNLVLIGSFFLTVGNTIYPFLTRPLRYFLIELVDNIFEGIYKREQAAKANITKTETGGMTADEAHYEKYGTNRKVPGDPKE